MGDVWNGIAIIPVYKNKTITDTQTLQSLTVALGTIAINWDTKGAPPNVTGSSTLGFTLPSGYSVEYDYFYFLAGSTSPASPNGQFLSTINSTVATEKPLTSTIGVNYKGTDWLYGNEDNTQPPATLGNMKNSPGIITYNYSTDVDTVNAATWNIAIKIIMRDSGVSYNWEEIIGIILLVIVILILFYYLVSYFTSGPSTDDSTQDTGT